MKLKQTFHFVSGLYGDIVFNFAASLLTVLSAIILYRLEEQTTILVKFIISS